MLKKEKTVIQQLTEKLNQRDKEIERLMEIIEKKDQTIQIQDQSLKE